MTHTTNFNLSQWAKTDRIQMADFNADNAKIDAALAARNCRFYTTTYTGDGAATRTLTFPGKPVFLAIIGSNSLTVLHRGTNTGRTFWGSSAHKEFSVAWADGSVTLTHTASLYISNNTEAYGLFALLEAD